jgi:hypothetical protein
MWIIYVCNIGLETLIQKRVSQEWRLLQNTKKHDVKEDQFSSRLTYEILSSKTDVTKRPNEWNSFVCKHNL